MSLLDDARRLAASNIAENFDKECGFCGMSPSLHDVEGWEYRADSLGVLHYPECPWLSLPAIVAVLEAAERVASENGRLGDGWIGSCTVCGGGPMSGDPIFAQAHRGNCSMKALVKALRGELVVPSS